MLVLFEDFAGVGVDDIYTTVESSLAGFVEGYVCGEVVAAEYEVGDDGIVGTEGLEYIGLV